LAFRLFGRPRAVGLDVGTGSVKALMLERKRADPVITGYGIAAVEMGSGPRQVSQAVHAALAAAGADGAPVVAAVGGPDVVIRQVALPPVATSKMLSAMELQHRWGLGAAGEAVVDVQPLRPSREGTSNEVLSVSVAKGRVDDRMRLLQQAGATVQILDAEPLALLNGAIHLTGLEAGELIVLLAVGRDTSVLCLFSEQGPVVARYLECGAEALNERLRAAFSPSIHQGDGGWTLDADQAQRAEIACRDIVDRMAEDIRLSLTFYRTEYDRESLPRYTLGGSVDIPLIGRWLADRLGLGAPLELMDPFKALDVEPSAIMRPDIGCSGPQFLQAFGLALRAL